ETHLRSPLPVAMYASPGWCRTASMSSLDALDTAYRISYVSDTSGGLLAAVQAGLGVAPLARASIPANCRELTQVDGFPVIDHSNVTLRMNMRKSNPAAIGMAQAIREAFRGE